MEQIWRDFLSTLSIGSFSAAILFGVLSGAAYGWRATSVDSRSDAVTLFFVVLGFFLMRAFYNLLTGAPVGAGRSLGGILLWLVTVAALLLGRRLRLSYELNRRAREARRVE